MTEQSRDGYPDATGLLERSAAAFVGGVPEHGLDDGFFGPASVTWRTAADTSTPVAGLRALMIQALHPLAMAGVEQHSEWRQDPVGRLAATSGYLATVSFGSRASADRAAARVRRIHEHVTGTDEVTGRRYAASDPALLLWVHAALVGSTLVARKLFGVPLAVPDADAYVAEMAAAAELVGVPRDQVPASVAALDSYLVSMRPSLVASPAAREAAGYLLDPPGLSAEIAEIWQDVRAGVIGSLPDWAREMYDLPAESLTPDRRTEIRQALGVLDAVFLGQPGVLEARQRIAARVRAARQS
ncbi:MAG: oxygenase MpaB family protein [Streptosporangiaceae bacterium]